MALRHIKAEAHQSIPPLSGCLLYHEERKKERKRKKGTKTVQSGRLQVYNTGVLNFKKIIIIIIASEMLGEKKKKKTYILLLSS